MVEDHHIVSRIQQGDAQAFEMLIDRYKRLVGSIVFRMVPNEQDRQEVSQDVFIKAYKAIGKFRGDAKVSTWLGRIAYNTSINYLKKKQIPLYEDFLSKGANENNDDAAGRWDALGTAADNPENAFSKKEFSRFLKEAINDLPPQYGTVLALFHLEEQSLKEISDQLDMPAGTVKNYLFRARKLLKTRIEKSAYAKELWS